ncbi:MAG: hypothetical protein ACRD4Y_04345, partial [Candidatus Acidiferrales bacterium]
MMKTVAAQRRTKLARKFEQVEPASAISAVVFSKYSGKGRPDSNIPKTDVSYWRERLILRRYRFPASG